MASSLPVVIDDDLVQCKLCRQDAVQPTILPCLHTFCKTCLRRYISKLERSQCPTELPSQTAGKDNRNKSSKVNIGLESDTNADDLESYEIPVRTVDDYGYQIADEEGFLKSDETVYGNDESYYNKTMAVPRSPSTFATYTDMNSRRSTRSSHQKERASPGDFLQTDGSKGRGLKTLSEVSDEYIDPGRGISASMQDRCPSDIYDNVEDITEEQEGPDLTVKAAIKSSRKSSCSTDVKRWKVSNAVSPPKMVRRPKGSRASDGHPPQTQTSNDSVFESTTLPVQKKDNRTIGDRRNSSASEESTAAQLMITNPSDIYSETKLESPVSSSIELYGATNVVYGLEKQVSDCDDKLSSNQPLISEEDQVNSKDGQQQCLENNVKLCCEKFPCPVCKDTINMLEMRGLESMEDEEDEKCSFIKAMQEMSVFYVEGQKNSCTNCESKQATFKCFNCQHNLCDGCREAHNWLKITKDHQVVRLCDVRLGKHRKELKKMLVFRCRGAQHSAKEETSLAVAEFLCIVCNRIVCCECLKQEEHNGHATAPLEEVADRERYYLESMVESARGKLEKVTTDRNLLESYRQQHIEERLNVVSDIVRQKETLQRLIEEHCQALIEKVEIESGKEKRRIEERLSNLDRSRSKIQHSFKFVGQLLEHGRNADVIGLSPLVRGRLRAMKAMDGPPVMSQQMAVNFRPTLVEVDDIEQMMGLLSFQLKDAKKTGSNEESLNMKVIEMKGDPDPIPPRLLSSFVTRIASDDKGCKPTGIALTSFDDIVLVDDINKKIKIFSMGGKLQRELHPTDEGCRLVDPWDVAVLHKSGGNLAITDRGARDVKIFTESGEFVFSFGRHLSSPWGIATNSVGHILVTDITHRKVFVHDENGTLLSSIPSETTATADNMTCLLRCPEYVTVNANDDVIVSDFEQHSVTIYDKFGRLMTRYGDRNETPRKLKVPCGLAVDGEANIYVADYNNRRIVKLSPNGWFRCCYATNDSHLVMPQTLAVNQDGNLVVVDRTHVKIFAISQDDIKKKEEEEEEKPRPKPRKGKSSGGDVTTRSTPAASIKFDLERSTKTPPPLPSSLLSPEVSKDKKDADQQMGTRVYMETEVW